MKDSLYQKLFESSPVGNVYLRIIPDDASHPCDFEFVKVNPAFERLTGLDAPAIVGKRGMEVPDIPDKFRAELIKFSGEMSVHGGDIEILWKSSQQRYLRASFFPMEEHHVAVSFIDVTQEIVESHEKTTLINALNDYLFELDEEYTFTNIFASNDDELFVPRHLICGNNLKALFPEDLASNFISTMLEAKTSGRKESITYQSPLPGDDKWFKAEIQYSLSYRDPKYFVSIRNITGEVAKDRLIEEQENNFRMFFETITDLIFIAKPTGEIIHTNKAVNQKLGYTKPELEKLNLTDVHPRENLDEALQILADMLAGQRSSCPLLLQRKDGTTIPVETRVWLGTWDGQDCLFGLSKDLSEQQSALEKFHKLFNSNPTLIAVSQIPSGGFEDVNEAFLKKLGYTREEIIGKLSTELNLFVEPEKQKKIALELQQSDWIHDIELKVQKKDGILLDGLFSGEIIDHFGQKKFLTVMVDITEQKASEKAAQERELYLRTVLETTQDGFLVVDEKTRIIDVNEA